MSPPFEQANGISAPISFRVGGYDGMHLIYEALKKTNGNADGDALIAAMKGMAWESPRGPISIDPETRDIVQQHLHPQSREDERATLQHGVRRPIEAVKDPMKAAASRAGGLSDLSHRDIVDQPGLAQACGDQEAERACPWPTEPAPASSALRASR